MYESLQSTTFGGAVLSKPKPLKRQPSNKLLNPLAFSNS
jgi:hypothetical protein